MTGDEYRMKVIMGHKKNEPKADLHQSGGVLYIRWNWKRALYYEFLPENEISGENR